MSHYRNRFKTALQEGGSGILPLLKAVKESSDVFPPLKSAVAVALIIGSMVKDFKSNKEDWRKFGDFVQQALGYVVKSLPATHEPKEELKNNLTNLAITLENVRDEISALQRKHLHSRFWDFFKDPGQIDGMRKQVGEAMSLFKLGSMVTMGVDNAEILKCVKEKFRDKIVHSLALGDLPYAKGASWDESRGCLSGTRIEMLEDIWTWANNLNTTHIFWLADVAGAGKSAVAHTFAQRCFKSDILATSFFFDRVTPGRNSPRMLFSTIARDLARMNDEAEASISMAINHDPSLPTASISRQFDELILGPSSCLPADRPIVIVIDGLDEGYNHNNELLVILAEKVSHLPKNFRFLLTSRTEDSIRRFLHGKPDIERRSMGIREHPNMEDVAKYVKHRLKAIAADRALSADWPEKDRTDLLIKKAEGLFIWAATICEFLSLHVSPGKQLDFLLSSTGQSGLCAESKMDELYSRILGCCNWNDSDFVEGYGMVMGAIMATKQPLSMSALQSLHSTTLEVRVIDILRPLGSVLHGLAGPTEPIHILHLSFRDFLTDRAQSLPDSLRYYICEPQHSRRLALACLITMEELKRDICGIGDLSKSISEINNFRELVASHVPEELAYACRFWTDHVIDTDDILPPALVDALRSFLLTRLLQWIEVMALKELLHIATEILIKLRDWLETTLPDEADITALASDGVQLIQQFSMVIMQNPLHIYASVLLFAPTESPLRKAYLPSFSSLPRIITGLDSHWSSVMSTINIGGRSYQSNESIPEDSVRSITFNSDGSRIVIGSDDSMVRLWDHKSGTHIELERHSSAVTCVAFSPDESMIASSSVDGSVCIWDAGAETLTLKYEFQIDIIEHVDSSVAFRPALTSVIFSPDSHFVASGSSTGSIHIWSPSIELLWELPGHTSWICSLVFLPNGSQMASCSVDGMVCIWDATTWEFVRQPLDRHLYGVNFITFSPCGSQIAICFVDGSLRLESVGSCGDGQSETLSRFVSINMSPDCSHSVTYSSNCPPCLSSGSGAYIPIIGEETQVLFTFTTFSPTSHHVACRCGDGTVRLYDISANPASSRVVYTDAGNTGPVAFTDNGLEIGFYTSEGSIHAWDVGSETMRSVPGDSTECPLMISFSPDNVYIAVLYTHGYLDIWNIDDGTVTQFQHEGEWVNVIAFSLDQPLLAIGLSAGDVFVYNYVEGQSVFQSTDFKQPIVELHFMAGQSGWTLLKEATIGGLCSTQNVTGTSGISGSLVCFGYSSQGTVCAAFSADGSMVASSSATARVTVWDSLTGIPTARFISRECQAMGAMVFSRDSCQIAAGSHQGIVHIWKLDGQQWVNSDAEDFDHVVSSATVSSNGQRIAVLQGSRTLLLLDPSNINNTVSTLPQIDRCQFSPDGKLLVSCSLDGHLQVQETDTGHVISRSLVKGALKLLLQEFSPDSRHIITINETYDIQLWHADTEFREGCSLGRASSGFAGRGEIYGMKFTSDSSRILEYEYDSPTFGLRVLEMDGTVRYQGSNSCSSPDGLRIVQLPPLPIGASHRLVTYEPNGAFSMHEIIGTGAGDKDETLQVLDSSTSVVLYKLEGAFHIGSIFFSPDGAFMAGSSCTGIQVWKLDAGWPVWNLDGFYWPCAFSPDSSMLAAYDEAGILYAWRLDTHELISQSHCLSGDRIDNRYQEDHLNDFFHWQCNKDNPLYAKSGLIRMGHEGWVGTRDLRKLFCVPLEYQGYMETGGRTAVITTRDQRLVVICMADDDEQ